MKIKHLASAGALAAAFLSPGMASASFLLDTGTPSGATSDTFNSSTWYAEEFSVAAGESVSNVAAYLTQGAGQLDATFTFAIYANSGAGGNFIGSTPSNRGADEVASGSGTFNGSGWTSATVNWTPSSGGDYWLAIQQTSSGTANSLDAPTEASATTGTAPALAYAIYSTSAGSKYQLSGGDPIGLEVTAAPVPLPGALWLLGSGVAGLAGMARRRRQ
jgi:hypothetical protein